MVRLGHNITVPKALFLAGGPPIRKDLSTRTLAIIYQLKRIRTFFCKGWDGRGGGGWDSNDMLLSSLVELNF